MYVYVRMCISLSLYIYIYIYIYTRVIPRSPASYSKVAAPLSTSFVSTSTASV